MAQDIKQARWFQVSGPIATCEGSAVAAMYARLVACMQPNPRALPLVDHIFELQVPGDSVQDARLSRRWFLNRPEVRACVDEWLAHESSLVLRVPSVSGSHQYLLNLRHPGLGQCRVFDRGAYPYSKYLPAVESALADPSKWLCLQ
ncbi:hypothetical protein V8Z80_16945 [Orrella sp. JC864]|uniref:hypothetical protein n=1 Tax=Orrella sp. JC864 TaxID=3120298 RepID=UPI0030092607